MGVRVATSRAVVGLRRPWALVRDYVQLGKPGIVALVAATTLGGYYLAAPPLLGRDWLRLVAALVGTVLAAAAAAVFNNVYDRDIDGRMARTRRRPIHTGRVSVRAALSYGAILVLLSQGILLAFVGPLAAFLAVVALFSYAVVYTIWLKRHSPLSTELGGVVGAIPPMIGWVAATGRLELGAWVLFALLFLWQPPHFWALAVVKREEYRRVGIPLVPVVYGVEETKRRTLLYSLLLLVTSVVPYLIGIANELYLAVALVLGALWLRHLWRFLRSDGDEPGPARGFFFYTIFYLFALFAAMVVANLEFL